MHSEPAFRSDLRLYRGRVKDAAADSAFVRTSSFTRSSRAAADDAPASAIARCRPWSSQPATACDARSMAAAISPGCDTYKAWLPATSVTREPARAAIARWAGGGIMRSSVATM